MIRLFSITCVLLLSACATAPLEDITVNAEADPKAQFSGYKTYAWLATAQILYDPEGQWEPRNVDIDAEVQKIINIELRMRGKVEDAANPDMLVVYAAGVDMTTLDLKENPETSQKLLENIPEAALIVALIDADTGYVVWLGEAVGDVQQQANKDTVRTRIQYAVSQMFRLLPKN
mgnify:CR=1 FL=1